MERDVIENINNSKKNPKEIKTNKKKNTIIERQNK
jgi:hypothetical protein